MSNRKTLALHTPYVPAIGSWSFLKNDLNLCTCILRCKDYSHEQIACAVHNKLLASSINCQWKKDSNINLSYLHMAMIANSGSSKNFYWVKRLLNKLEKKAGLEKTVVKKVMCTGPTKKTYAFIIKASLAYIKSPILLHYLISLFRTSLRVESERVLSCKNMENYFFLANGVEGSVLSIMYKEGIIQSIMNNHKKIIGGLTLKEIYPENVTAEHTNYHGGFGCHAILTNTLAVKKYANRVATALKSDGIVIDYKTHRRKLPW